ncbi:hypothetical protein [Burkholderia stabilis]|uniref:hypothetical protein n=1 Tax=Burkholderia stabilis TaxID=95485 RepID=UPI001F4AE71B|nr:hypothetical protein [Burkholderia stabilis]
MFRKMLLVAVVVLLSACSSPMAMLNGQKTGEVAPEKLNAAFIKSNIIPRKTTKSDIVNIYGETDDKVISSDGVETWSYEVADQSSFSRKIAGLAYNYLPIPGKQYDNATNMQQHAVNAIAPQQKYQRLRIVFDSRGFVRDYTLM